MGQALYRKYRPKALAEIVGQEHVATTLANALKSGKISHAYLLSGPRGVGKTSIARILAHEINGLSYTDEAHLDIIEIDAASNRRIDEIREIRERVNTAPSSAKYKVYIIDEVHMLTKEAFNALLKTLEEPPAHVVFILATTEAHKLPETILSRTQRYTLRLIPQEQVIGHLRHIAEGEKIAIDDDALELIAEHGGGSFRDSVSLLDQAGSGGGKIARADVERILGLAPGEYIAKLHAAVVSGDHAAVVATLADLHTQGFEPAAVARQLSSALRADVLEGRSPDPAASLGLLQKLIDVPASRSPQQLLEIVLLQTALPPAGKSITPAVVTVPASTPVAAQPAPTTTPEVQAAEPEPEPKTPESEDPAASETPAEQTAEQPAPAGTTNPAADAADELDADELWHQALEAIKKQYNTLYGIARMAQPELQGGKLTLTFKFAFHQKRINEAKNRKLLSDVVERLYGQPLELVCIVAEAPAPAAKADISAVSDIFGGAELMES